MTKQHRIQVAKYLNYLINEEDYSVIGTDKKEGVRVEDYAISVNHKQKQIILKDKEDNYFVGSLLK